jgi:hypothetical protein
VKLSSYHRKILDTLKHDYGVVPRIEEGGNHPALVFTYCGQPHRITMHNDGHESDILKIKLQDIRRTLGPAKTNGQTPKRTMENLMSDLVREAREAGHDSSISTTNPVKDIHAVGAMAGYQANNTDNPRLRFFIPSEIVKPFLLRLGLVAPVYVNMGRKGTRDWEISFNPNGTGRGVTLRTNGPRYSIDAGVLISEGLDCFGTTPADYVLIGTTILVALKADQLRPVQLGNSQVLSRNMKKETTKPEAVAAPTPPKQVHHKIPTDDEMQRALFTIRSVEEQTPFRLTKIRDEKGSRWVFQARIE